ncbi:uroporphyrinogen-III synthase [Ectobacillus sp. sgz5001026]|uniref:uroporphyrinogen-III synthase n=1 Tax=Ectobacillus sp. sgz5001026 TaxID=3242473 RepID=UPI0036D43794
MGNVLEGKQIVIGGSRKTDEMRTLIEKQGGTPIVRSLQGTVFLAEKEVEPNLRQFIEEGADWIIFTTGIGIETLLKMAEQIGMADAFLTRIREAKVAVRGYKSYAALKKLDIQPVAVDDDGTTRGLIRALQPFAFANQRVMVQLHGDAAPSLLAFLEGQGSSVLQLLPYQHIAPKEEVVEQLSQELLNYKIDAVCFTTAIQVRGLFDWAKKHGHHARIVQLFHDKTVAVSIGKLTTEALQEEGIKRIVAPENERMGAMIIELVRYYEESHPKSYS